MCNFICKKTNFVSFVWSMIIWKMTARQSVWKLVFSFFVCNFCFACRAESLNIKYVPFGCDFGCFSQHLVRTEKWLDSETQMVVSHLVRTWCERVTILSSCDWQAVSFSLKLSSGGCLIPVGLINAALKPWGTFIQLSFSSDFWWGGLLSFFFLFFSYSIAFVFGSCFFSLVWHC